MEHGESLLMTLHYKDLSLQCFRQPSGDFSHRQHSLLRASTIYRALLQRPEQLAKKHLLHSSALQSTLPWTLESLAAPGEAPILLKAGAGEGTGLVLKN